MFFKIAIHWPLFLRQQIWNNAYVFCVTEHCERYAKAENVGKRLEEGSDDDELSEDEYDSNDDERGRSSDR